jgi:F-type H+-transporting ATPase subunit delta
VTTMQGRKVLASLALNMALALVVLGTIVYKSSNGQILGSSLTRASSMRMSRPVYFNQHMQRHNLAVNAGKIREPVAEEYGSGLAQLALEENKVDDIQRDLTAWMEVFKADPEARDFLYDPLGKVEDKKAAIDEVTEKAEMSELTSNFLNLLLDMGRFEQLEDIAEVFEEEIMAQQGTKSVLVKAAVELDDDAMFGIAEKMKELTGVKNLKMTQEIDDDLLSGFVIEMEGQRIDMSLKNELEQLKAELLKPVSV